MRTLLLTFTAVMALLMSGCFSGKKSSARIYQGDGPSITYSSKRESAGGNLNTR